MNQRAGPGIREWSRAASAEPSLRVGIILAEDAQQTVHLALQDTPYTLAGVGSGGTILAPGATVAVRTAGDKLAFQVNGGPTQTAALFRLVPAAAVAHRRGTGLLVHDVIAGRGFHWQKPIDQTLSGTIELRPGRRGVVLINELPLEGYLAGVITAEMSGDCPADLLKAQCVVARSWLLAMTEPKHEGEPFDRCNDDCCQRYQGTGGLSVTAIEAVRATRGVVRLAPSGVVLDATYAKSCGGISETPWAVWGLDKPGISPIVDAPPDAFERGFFPVTEQNLDEYLDGAWLGASRCYCSPNVVPEEMIGQYLGRVDTAGEYFRWSLRYSHDELAQLLREKLDDARELTEVRDLRVRARGVSGRAYSVEVEFASTRGEVERRRLDSEYRIRQVLHRKFLYSSAFAVRTQRGGDGRLEAITLRGAGWGHGVGLCQIGALGMALSGIEHEAICRHYYPKAELASVYP